MRRSTSAPAWAKRVWHNYLVSKVDMSVERAEFRDVKKAITKQNEKLVRKKEKLNKHLQEHRSIQEEAVKLRRKYGKALERINTFDSCSSDDTESDSDSVLSDDSQATTITGPPWPEWTTQIPVEDSAAGNAAVESMIKPGKQFEPLTVRAPRIP